MFGQDSHRILATPAIQVARAIIAGDLSGAFAIRDRHRLTSVRAAEACAISGALRVAQTAWGVPYKLSDFLFDPRQAR